MTGANDYEDHFTSVEAVRAYDAQYRPGTRDALIWHLQRRYLDEQLRHILDEKPDLRALDFACGSGRVLEYLSEQGVDAVGLEVSSEMGSAAAARVPKARLVVKDGLSPGALQEDEFDLITALRFFLNTSDEARRLALTNMYRWLAPRNGCLICNMHGNSSSLRHFAVTRSRRSTFKNELSERYMRSLLQEAGFTIVDVRGFGLFPDVLYRTRLRRLVAGIDRLAAARRPFTPVSIDVLYVAVAS